MIEGLAVSKFKPLYIYRLAKYIKKGAIVNSKILLENYFENWIEIYKKPLVRQVTYSKYENTLKQIKSYFPNTLLDELTPLSYQKSLNQYAKTHAKLTTACFHKHIHACLLDALDEGLIKKDPSRKAIITGTVLINMKPKYLNYEEWQKLIQVTAHSEDIKDLIIYMGAVTGLRYSEILGLTWDNLNQEASTLTVEKTWDYKNHNGFVGTKNTSSNRVIFIDDQTLCSLQKVPQKNEQIFFYASGKQLYSGMINRHLKKLCIRIGIPVISFHALRHTHASILLYKGVNVIMVSKRLGHHDVSTTQNIYLHVISELENREKNLIEGIIRAALE